jgi:hypothetical protein
MLEKAGWREGTGLGANAQGPLAPVETFIKADRRGIGAETVSSLQVVGAEARPAAKRPPRPPGGDAAGGGGAAGGAADAEEGPTQQELSREQARARRAARCVQLPCDTPLLCSRHCDAGRFTCSPICLLR